MEINPATQHEIEIYKKIMMDIEFMEKYLNEPEIFNPDSVSFKNFLIQSFCYLYSDFHYLSFLSKEDVNHEIVKVAAILQILPKNTKEILKLFDNMSKDDIHKFWLKFFTLFKNQNEFSTIPILTISLDDKINFFKSVANTLNYMNYEFPGVNKRKFNSVNICEEISTWGKQEVENYISFNESTSFNNNGDQSVDVDVNKLMSDLKQVLSIYCNQKLVNQLNKPEYIDFFNVFLSHTKNFLEFKKNLNIINSIFLDKLNFVMLLNDENLSQSFFFIKRCNNYVRAMKSKIKALH